MSNVLVVDDIHTYYGKSYILQGLSLKVEQGTAVALVGRNGSGKTTTIRSIIGFNHPRDGEIYFKGENITRLTPFRISRMGMSLVPQGRRIFPSLSLSENLLVAAHYSRNGTWDIEKVYTVFPRLRERSANRGDQLSGGELQMLAIARSLVSNPDFILMDEPSEGLAPLVIQEISSSIQQFKKDGFSILLAEQNLAFALGVADYVYVISKGRVVFEGHPGALQNDENTKREYLSV